MSIKLLLKEIWRYLWDGRSTIYQIGPKLYLNIQILAHRNVCRKSMCMNMVDGENNYYSLKTKTCIQSGWPYVGSNPARKHDPSWEKINKSVYYREQKCQYLWCSKYAILSCWSYNCWTRWLFIHLMNDEDIFYSLQDKIFIILLFQSIIMNKSVCLSNHWNFTFNHIDLIII